ncbi:hypothetical protein NUW54_g12835 [Trametes sanguinea]|uniref:Uncharacterized protein n=1 Tax=Trametes sanguinea TaxID=158606 RepID=A0ACC1MUQ4_9APHY|nr:hypothetical protein NUW54_g12835 [Trametes sanguinea]
MHGGRKWHRWSYVSAEQDPVTRFIDDCHDDHRVRPRSTILRASAKSAASNASKLPIADLGSEKASSALSLTADAFFSTSSTSACATSETSREKYGVPLMFAITVSALDFALKSDEGWGVNLAECIQIWREGCIIRSEYIADLLQAAYEKEGGVMNTLTLEAVGDEIKRTIPHLLKVVKYGLEWNAHIPTLSASLEYFKYCGGKHLPSQFMEAELDYFGAHNYELKSEGDGEVKKGEHHYEWKPA